MTSIWGYIPSAEPNHQPELTARAILLGLCIGCLVAFTNLYLGLQSGWVSMMSIQSALLGRLLGLMFKKPFTASENVILQTTAVATGTMPLAAGFVGIIPALSLLDRRKDGADPVYFDWMTAVSWSFGIAFFGVFLAVPLRKQTIIKEKLAFPSGTATAQLIGVMYRIPLRPERPKNRRGYQAIDESHLPDDTEELIEDDRLAQDREVIGNNGWKALSWSFGASTFVTLLAYFFPVVFAIPIFGLYLAREWLWWFTPSLSYVGQGIIMGFPTTVSMNLGMFVGWAILSPICKHAEWAPGHVSDQTNGARGWILWVALAIMSADSLISVIPVAAEFAAHLGSFEGWTEPPADQIDCNDGEVEPPMRLVPKNWVVAGVITSVFGGTFVIWLVFGDEGIRWWATILGFGLGGVLSLLGVRALGETDLNPVSGLGKISQLLFAVIQPGNVVANIIAGGVAEAGAQQAGDLMQDFKTGHLLGASPRAQFICQLIGSFASIFATTTLYNVYTKAYQIPGPNFPAPTAYVWLNLARLLRAGELPPKTGVFMTLFGTLFAILSVLKLRKKAGHPAKWSRWIPSGVAFAIGFLNTPSFSLARLVGGLIEFWWRRRMASIHKQLPVRDTDGETDGENDRDDRALVANQDEDQDHGARSLEIVIMASGFVLGEGVASIINLCLRMAGVGVVSCWGCAEGVCGSC